MPGLSGIFLLFGPWQRFASGFVILNEHSPASRKQELYELALIFIG